MKHDSMKHDSRLILKPGAQPQTRRALWGVVTALFWIVYLYLWAPLVTLALWLLGVRLAVFELYLRERQIDPFLLMSLPLLALAAAAVLISWAELNRLRFAGRDKRHPTLSTRHDQVASALGATPAVAAQALVGKVVVLQMDHNARPLAVHAGELGQRLSDPTGATA